MNGVSLEETPLNPPLVVDLDGTLVRSDLLVESGFAFLRHQPRRAFALLRWLAAGKANLKQRLASEVPLDVTFIPYEPLVVDFLGKEKAEGRPLILATSTHQRYADDIAAHLGLFDRVLATNGHTNLSARAKRDVLVSAFGEKGFDYVGNSRDDLAVWAAARKSHLANPEIGVAARAARFRNVEQVIRSSGKPWRAWMRQLRLHQWTKNLLIFVPLLAAHKIAEFDVLFSGVLAFLLFSMCASSVYLLNDLLDLEDDRQHPSKRYRPLASGTVSIKTALLAMPALLLGAFAGAIGFMPWKFWLALGSYYGLTLAYSLVLKRVMMLDVITLAMLYTLRLIAGAFAFQLSLTFWILAFSMFMFLSLALVKRYAELREERSNGKTERTKGRGYYPGDLEMISSLGAASGYLAVMVLALYVQEPATAILYRHPRVIWLACPVLLYWISHTWLLAHRGQMHDDPVVFAMKDRFSLLLGVLFGAIFWFAT
jgi:4-hydroxybenzoate polyprenyltransferase/phosphoglycolate phosphatase-like HAD superfamily hydrolase